jgi:hypothetical protein
MIGSFFFDRAVTQEEREQDESTAFRGAAKHYGDRF